MSSLGEEQPSSINDGHNTHLPDTIQDPVVLEKYSAGEEQEIEATSTISETDQSNAEEFKNQGNDFLKSEFIVLIKLQHNLQSLMFRVFFPDKDYNKAIELYTKAIELDPKNAVFYANRSLAHLRQESFGSALLDGIAAVNSNPLYLKGYYRRAAAQMSLGKFKQALSDFEYVSILN